MARMESMSLDTGTASNCRKPLGRVRWSTLAILTGVCVAGLGTLYLAGSWTWDGFYTTSRGRIGRTNVVFFSTGDRCRLALVYVFEDVEQIECIEGQYISGHSTDEYATHEEGFEFFDAEAGQSLSFGLRWYRAARSTRLTIEDTTVLVPAGSVILLRLHPDRAVRWSIQTIRVPTAEFQAAFLHGFAEAPYGDPPNPRPALEYLAAQPALRETLGWEGSPEVVNENSSWSSRLPQ